MGLTVSDEVRILLTRTANEGARPLELIGNAAAQDAWFRSKVREVIDDKWPDIAHEDVEARFTARHEGSLRKSGKGLCNHASSHAARGIISTVFNDQPDVQQMSEARH
jgi:DNA-damage-inducible protein J